MWYHSRHTPMLNVYLDNAWITIGSFTLITPAYLLSEDLTSTTLKEMELYLDVVRYSCTIVRLMDDLGTSTDELQRGDVSKSIQCYMKEKNVSEAVTRDHIKYLIRENWKGLNGEKIGRSKFEESFKRFVINFPRMAHLLYQYGDGFGKPNHETRVRIIYLLIEPIAL
ncbi:hypothetical protein HPP92_023995 [Vanilla planifolia]|uniref:Terpene synthase metal-binding domain-containing protein n=1 Tax=Vanilla planifolia TaxID=51239 RepID=A0A835PU93_VANPL|nr:hypothetical protein HPP92_023995 [Vanilla planifolia]